MLKIDYTGKELRQGIAFQLLGEKSLSRQNIITGRGKCDVTLEHMVDLEDVRNEEPIYSDDMFHILLEFSGERDIEKLVFIQRYVVRLIADILLDYDFEDSPRFRVDGDDIMIGPKKLSVSIATLGHSSGLIHIGLNANAKKFAEGVNAATLAEIFNTEVKKIKDSNLADPFTICLEAFEDTLYRKLREEFKDITIATAKVTGV